MESALTNRLTGSSFRPDKRISPFLRYLKAAGDGCQVRHNPGPAVVAIDVWLLESIPRLFWRILGDHGATGYLKDRAGTRPPNPPERGLPGAFPRGYWLARGTVPDVIGSSDGLDDGPGPTFAGCASPARAPPGARR